MLLCVLGWEQISTTYFREVSEVARLTKIKFICIIVDYHPGEHWVLVQVIVRPTCKHCKMLPSIRETDMEVI